MSSFAEEICERNARHYRIGARHIESGGVGYNQGYTTLEFFLAPDPDQFSIMPFVDCRGHIFDNGKLAANAGLGIRALKDCRVYGANVYYDYRNTKHQHYNQIGFGFETLGNRWDFRANAYLPVGPKTSPLYNTNTTSVTVFDTFQGNSLLTTETFTTEGKVQFAMSGINTEVAFHILQNENIDLSAAIGPYYYNYRSNQAFGGQARIRAQVYDYLSLEIINSYDSRFHENIQGSIGFNIPLGPKSKISKNKKLEKCSSPCLLAQRLLQDVERQEIIVVDKKRKTVVSEETTAAIDPLTGEPYVFVFVDNTSNSLGTYESPYPTLALAEANSNPNDIIYIFPGDGTSTGMNSGIFLKAGQSLLGSGVSQSIETSKGEIIIPALSLTSPIITNNDSDTDGNAITLATNNVIRGITIKSAINNAIYGTDPQNLTVSTCRFEETSTYPIETIFSGSASISITDNQFLNNVNGVSISVDGNSNIVCLRNTFERQTSVSSIPLEITSDSNSFNARIENNLFNNNETGSIRFNLTNIIDANITTLNNTITNNRTGSLSSLGSNFVILPDGAIDRCTLLLTNNTFSDNVSNSLYLHTSGSITTLDVTVSTNTISDNGGGAIVLATPASYFTLLATDNTISNINDNAIAVIGSGSSATGNITINNNSITDIGNYSNGIAINQNFSILDLTISNNDITGCEGTGIISYASSGINSLTLDISDNTISNCQNLSANAASGLDIEQFTNFIGSITNNTLSDNESPSLVISSTLTAPSVCLTLNGNNSTDYSLTNPGDGTFNLSPCNVDDVNVGTINTSGTINTVQSCPGATPCPP